MLRGCVRDIFRIIRFQGTLIHNDTLVRVEITFNTYWCCIDTDFGIDVIASGKVVPCIAGSHGMAAGTHTVKKVGLCATKTSGTKSNPVIADIIIYLQ
jgi:hypothetical protein